MGEEGGGEEKEQEEVVGGSVGLWEEGKVSFALHRLYFTFLLGDSEVGGSKEYIHIRGGSYSHRWHKIEFDQ